MKLLLTTIFISFFIHVNSQNLVKNPSFELRKREGCFVFLGDFDRESLHWTKPNNGSTDSFLTCSSNLGIQNYNGNQKAKDGAVYCGIYTFSPYNNYREYIQGELKETLIAGKTYKMKFYISLADMATHAIKEIQVLFTEEKLVRCFNKNSCEKVIVPKKATNKKFRLYRLEKEDFLTERDQWQELSFEFIASGYETYLSIGNFNKDHKTELKEILTVSRENNKFSYYYIDEVSLKEISELDNVDFISNSIKNKIPYKTDSTYVFKNVLFDFDKAILLDTSKLELNKLYNHLIVNPELKIEVYGHTDNIGLAKRNKELSKQRAKAVADYLILQGLNSSKVAAFGYGSSKPISDNNTEEGRQTNRRVEFKLIKN